MSQADDIGIAREAARQQALVAALWAVGPDASVPLNGWCRNSPVTVARGLQAYRANGGANAARALATAYPTVCALIGDNDFQHLARELWSAQPPVRGDLAQWGEHLPAWLQAHAALGDWPYLADCARLDWAVHQCERAADAELDAPSIARLGDTDPERLHLVLHPGLAVVASSWPIATIHDAHRDGAQAELLSSAREALLAGVGESALVFRSGWRAQVRCVDHATAIWTQHLLAGDSLAAAMEEVSAACVDDSFDLAAWLGAALASGWLKGITVADD